MKNVALFGGSFDPPHNGHLAVVNEALQRLDIDKLIIVPAYLNPFKKHAYASAPLRLQWLKSIFADHPKVEVSDFEVSQGVPTPSITTVRHLYDHEAIHRLYFIIGADHLATLTQWTSYEALDRLVTWVIATRGNVDIPEGYITLPIDQPISSTDLRCSIELQHLPPKIAKDIATFYKEHHATTH